MSRTLQATWAANGGLADGMSGGQAAERAVVRAETDGGKELANIEIRTKKSANMGNPGRAMAPARAGRRSPCLFN